MKYWDRVKKDLQTAMKEGTDLFKEGTAALTTGARRMTSKGATTVKSEAQRIAKVSKIQYRLLRLNQKMQGKVTEIGGELLGAAAKDPKRLQVDGKVRKLVLEARKIQGEIRRLKSQMQRLSKGRGKKVA